MTLDIDATHVGGGEAGPLAVPERGRKPRSRGLNMLIDPGLPTQMFADYVASFHELIDGVKFGWGTSAITPQIDQKIAILKDYDVTFWFGGTMFEIAYVQDRLDDLVAFVERHGARTVEISDGLIELPSDVRVKWIKRLAERYTVLTEVGSKDSETVMSPSEWVSCILRDLEAGASHVIAEGRESGTSGIYRPSGEVREGLVIDLTRSEISMDKMVFEAPSKKHQVWFLTHLAPDVSLGNIPFTDIVSIETMRLGLRADTAQFAIQAG